MANTELAVVDKNYQLLTRDLTDLQELVGANLGGDSLSPRDIDTIGMPKLGGTQFTVPSSAGDLTVKEIEGIIVFHRMTRSRYDNAYSGEAVRPDCFSMDNETGFAFDEEGQELIEQGKCHLCPAAKFDKDEDTGKIIPPKCKSRMELYVITPEVLLPVRMYINVTSLKTIRAYLTALVKEGKHFFGVKTRFHAEKDKSKGGFDCTRIVATQVAPLTGEDLNKARYMADQMRELALRSKVETVEPVMDLTDAE